ncbi:MAG: SRPBCC domain-containing protein [Microthrixaceae bacterium]|nr:SRPBCC domain-containing protein [Microthrixaceae bacterium]
MAQIDDVVADSRTFAAEMPAEARILGDTTVRIGRVVRGTPEAIWAAHHDPDLVARWMTGPDGWSMPVCETATQVGANYRYVWRNDADGASFQSTGEVLEMAEPHRVVFTERMEGDMIPEGAPGTLNEVTFTALEGGTLVVVVVTYPDAQTRDAVLRNRDGRRHGAELWRLETDVLDS